MLYMVRLPDHGHLRINIELTGAGALCSPLVATQFAQQRHWSFHYLASLGLAVINTVVLVGVFRLRRQDGGNQSCYKMINVDNLLDCLREIGQLIPEHLSTEQFSKEDGKFRQILSHKTVQLLAFYILIYVGVEVTIGSKVSTSSSSVIG